jgi:DNA-binding CsgD family transcriptional regulator
MKSRLSAFTGHLDRCPYGFVLTDEGRRVLYTNAATNITGRRDGLCLESGRLKACEKQEDAALCDAAVNISAGRSDLRRLSIARPVNHMPYRLLLMPVASRPSVALGTTLPAVAILIVDAESAPAPAPGVLREFFSLTQAEARTASMLVQGQSIEEIATAMGVGIETVRTHVRRALSKTGTSRQGELIALVLRSVPFVHM